MSGQRPRGQRVPAQSGGSGGSAARPTRPAQPQQPNAAALVAGLSPIMEAYGYTEAEIIALVKRCNYDQAAIQAAVSHILEEREGHEHGDWETTDTADTKKEKAVLAKERKAQKEKERLEEEESEKQRYQERREEEKKRHLEAAARRKAFEEEKKNKPGSALVQKAAPWRPTAQDATTEKDSAANGYVQGGEDASQEPEVAVQEDYPAEEESPIDETQEQVASSWAQPSYDAAETPADEQYPVSGQMYGEPSTSDYVMSAPPGVPPIPYPSATWSAPPMAGMDGNGTAVAAGASQTAPWTSSWSADGGAWNDQTSATANVQQRVNGKSQWVVTPVVPRLTDDSVIMPSSFWDLIAGGPIPEVPFGSLLLEAPPAAEPLEPEGDVRETYHEAQEAAGEEKTAQQDDGRTAPREKPQYGDRRSGGGKKGGKKGGYRAREEKGEKGDAGADDGKGKSSRKGAARGSGGDRGGPGGSSGKGKGWREKGDKGERQKGGGKTPSQ